jgi:hypothetical protein
MPVVTLTKITKHAGGAVEFHFGKRSRWFPSIAAATEYLRETFGKDDMEDVAMALALMRQPTLNNVAILEGRSLTVNLNVANWGTLS